MLRQQLTQRAIRILMNVGDDGTDVHGLFDDVRVAGNGIHWDRVLEVTASRGSAYLLQYPAQVSLHIYACKEFFCSQGYCLLAKNSLL